MSEDEPVYEYLSASTIINIRAMNWDDFTTHMNGVVEGYFRKTGYDDDNKLYLNEYYNFMLNEYKMRIMA